MAHPPPAPTESHVTEFLLQYGLFLAKSATWVVAIVLVAGSLFALVREARAHAGQDRLEVKNLNERFENMADFLNMDLLSEQEQKAQRKARKAELKRKRKAEKQGSAPRRPRVFSLQFEGDLHASAADTLREEISALLQVARDDDEVLLKLESEGGLVHAYGLAASQLQRLRKRGLRLTVAVDKVAASGGYLMACVADRIIAAPFAVLGSIGVVAQLPNFNRLLKKHEVDIELHTAGAYKRTLTMLGENTEEGRAKFREELEDTHTLFKQFVTEHRPVLDINAVATGEHWYGTRAQALKLVDEILTSDDWLLRRAKDADLYEIRYRKPQRLTDRLARGLVRLGLALQDGVARGLSRRGV
jgi:serine protease SohB